MALNYVTLVCDLYDGQGNPAVKGTAAFTPTVQLTDTADHAITTLAPVPGVFRSGSFPQVKLLATDNAAPLPAGWGWTVSFDGVPGSPAGFTFFLPFTGGATQYLSSMVPVAAPSTLLGSTAAGVSVYPSGDTSGVTDQANITTAEALGRTVYFAPGTFWIKGLTKQANTIWQCSGRYLTTIKLAAGSNADVVQGASFGSLTLSGSLAGIGGWGIRDCTIDGNKAAQSGTSYGIRVYGYNFDLTNVSIVNCLTDGLYTEWGNFGQPGPDQSMEARYYGLKIEGCGGNGWRNRGPHDSRAYDVTIFGNGSGAVNYWAETDTGLTTAVAAGSNGASVASFTGSGVLNVSTALGYPAASISAARGALTVATSNGSAVITYTGTTATSFTGCTTVSGTGTLSTGGTVAPVGGYSANGCLLFGVHCYGQTASWQYVIDAQNHLVDCIGEVAATGACLVRAPNTQILGGQYFVVSGASQTGCGIQLGDTANGAFGLYLRTYVSNFACTSAATSGLNIVNDVGQNDIEVGIFATSGSVLYSGTPSAATSYKIRAFGQATAANIANSLWHDRGVTIVSIPPSLSQSWLLTSAFGSGDVINVSTSGAQIQYPGGFTSRWYADSYVTPALDINGANGHILPRSGSAGSLKPAASNGTYATGAAMSGNCSDTAGQVTGTMVASPGAGSVLTVTFKTSWGNHPVVVITPTTAAAAQIQTYLTQGFGFFTINAAVVPPAGVDSQAVGWNYIVLGQDA